MAVGVTVAVVSFLTYIIAGFVQNPVVPLIIGLGILVGVFALLSPYIRKNAR